MAGSEHDVPVAVLDDLVRIARGRAPLEACGLLVGTRAEGAVRVEYATESPNLAGSPIGFALDPMHVVREEAKARVDGREVVAVWHSHPNSAPEPSAFIT